MITILASIACVAIGFGWVQFVAWVVRRADRIECEPLRDPPCRMCDKPAIPPDHDCADPVDGHFATIPQAIDCSALGDEDLGVLRRNTEDLTEGERDALEADFADAVALFQGPVPYVPGPEIEEQP